MKICTIIITYNPNITSFRECFVSHLSSQSDKIVIVDNGSLNREEILQIINDYRDVEFIALEENKGIAFAQNIGITYAKEHQYDFVLLFDQDTIVPISYTKNILNSYVRIHDYVDEKIAVVGPNYVNPANHKYHPQIIYKNFKLHHFIPDDKSDEFTELSFIIASGSLIKIDVLNEVGLMDESLFIDSVDIEWCFRAASFGYKTYVSNKLKVYHTIGDEIVHSFVGELSIHSAIRNYYIYRNELLLFRNTAIPFGYKVRSFFMSPIYIGMYLIGVKFSKKYIYYILKGLCHGVIGRTGKYK